MAHRLSKITTRTGDRGETGLGDGSRVSKSSARVRALGDLDELNSAIGLVLAEDRPADVADALSDVQHDLFDLGGEVSIPGHALLTDAHVERLEPLLVLAFPIQREAESLEGQRVFPVAGDDDGVRTLRLGISVLAEEGIGIPVSLIPLPAGVAGAYGRREEHPFIFVSSNDAPVRRRFTLAHELGHHALGHAGMIDRQEDIYGGSGSPREIWSLLFP